MGKAEIDGKKTICTRKLSLNLRKELVKYHFGS
jgi:hypothetical protein